MHDFDRVFLVTEGQEYLRKFKKSFGHRLQYSQACRPYRRNAYRYYPRPLHMYRLGLEVLSDAIILSRCGGLVSGNSNVSEAAIMLNRGRYRVNHQILLGMNSSDALKARFLWRTKCFLPEVAGGFPRDLGNP